MQSSEDKKVNVNKGSYINHAISVCKFINDRHLNGIGTYKVRKIIFS